MKHHSYNHSSNYKLHRRKKKLQVPTEQQEQKIFFAKISSTFAYTILHPLFSVITKVLIFREKVSREEGVINKTPKLSIINTHWSQS